MMASDLDDCFRGRVGLQAVLGFFCGHGKGKGNKQRGGICLIGCAGKAPWVANVLAMRCSSAGLFLVSSCARAPDDSLRVTERSKHALAETLRLDCAMDEYDAGARSDAGDPMRNEDQPRLVLSPQRMKRALLAEAAGSRCPTRQRARGWLADGKKERNGLFEGWSVGPSGAALRVSNAERWATQEPDELRIECGVGWCLDPWRPLTVQRAEWRSVQVAGALVDPAGPRTGSVQGCPCRSSAGGLSSAT
ncbi:hypothetical protein ACCO45_005778 [Purpureocillium lilacinum]|uniref:Uncharacterized protein n=1 Tax=Purpureocillium lilacinum TaxID=33203 RepID=A0ACC4DWE4_PURLI